MSQNDFQKIFAKNLKTYMELNNINNVELSKKLNVSESTVGKWLLQKSIPRMGIIEKLSIIFNIEKSDLIEDKTSINNGYYHDKEVAEIAEQLRTNPEGRILFDASRDLSKEDIDIVLNLINGLKAKENKWVLY